MENHKSFDLHIQVPRHDHTVGERGHTTDHNLIAQALDYLVAAVNDQATTVPDHEHTTVPEHTHTEVASHVHTIEEVSNLPSSLDALIAVDEQLSNNLQTKLSTSGGTLSGRLSIGQGGLSVVGGATVLGGDTSVGNIIATSGSIRDSAGTERFLKFQTGSSNRWAIGVDNKPEVGSNSGSDFDISRYTDQGVLIDTPIEISRASGNIILFPVVINGTNNDDGLIVRSGASGTFIQRWQTSAGAATVASISRTGVFSITGSITCTGRVTAADAVLDGELLTKRQIASKPDVVRTAATGRWLLNTLDGGSIEVGDTGWRGISTIIRPVFGGNTWVARLRRIGSRVILRYRGNLTAPTASVETFMTLPAGFESGADGSLGVAWIGDTQMGYVKCNASNAYNIELLSTGGIFTAGQGVGFEVSWICDTAWPTTLPGTQVTAPRDTLTPIMGGDING